MIRISRSREYYRPGLSYLCILVTVILISSVESTSNSNTISCGSNVLQSSDVPRTLTSPLYPSTPPPLSCTWYILCPENMTLIIRLNDLDIEEDEVCKSEHRPCCTHNWLTLGLERVCGKNDSQRELTFDKPLNTVKFHSSKTLKRGRGFELLYFACAADQIRCANGLGCYNPSDKCDGMPKCADRSDEDDCDKSTETYYRECKDPMVPCGEPDPGCFHNLTGLCNDMADCRVTGVDEIYCGACGPKKLYCRSGGCYPYWGACDGVTHCLGGWDEGELAGCGICPSGYAPCSREDDCHCYHTKEQRCDERMDCPHGEDEVSCVSGCEDKIACASVEGCYSPSERCDGIVHCADKSDEIGCSSQLVSAKFKCANALQCIDELYVCNGIEDCSDGSDEADCIRTSVITIVIMGTLTCGMLAVMGTAFGWRYYVARIRANSMDANPYHRQIDQGPLDEETLYHLYREPPPSYHEAVLQGANPPVYCHPTRFVSLSNLPEETPPATAPRRIRPRGVASRRGIRQVPKPIELAKPIEDSTLTPTNSMASAVLAGDQLYPESGSSRDTDAPMLELSDNTTSNPDHLSDSESNSTGATPASDLISNESPNNNNSNQRRTSS